MVSIFLLIVQNGMHCIPMISKLFTGGPLWFLKDKVICYLKYKLTQVIPKCSPILWASSNIAVSSWHRSHNCSRHDDIKLFGVYILYIYIDYGAAFPFYNFFPLWINDESFDKRKEYCMAMATDTGPLFTFNLLTLGDILAVFDTPMGAL